MEIDYMYVVTLGILVDSVSTLCMEYHLYVHHMIGCVTILEIHTM